MNKIFFWSNQGIFSKIYIGVKFEIITYFTNNIIRKQRITEKEINRLITPTIMKKSTINSYPRIYIN